MKGDSQAVVDVVSRLYFALPMKLVGNAMMSAVSKKMAHPKQREYQARWLSKKGNLAKQRAYEIKSRRLGKLMTKKHFEWAAEYLSKNHHFMNEEEFHATLEGFVDLFVKFGPRFDEVRFREAANAND